MLQNEELAKCLVCTTQSYQNKTGDETCNCPRCGKYNITYEAIKFSLRELKNEERALISYCIRNEDIKTLTQERISNILNNKKLPNPSEQINKIIEFLGRKTKFFGDAYTEEVSSVKSLYSIMGAASDENYNRVFCEMENQNLIHKEPSRNNGSTFWNIELTMNGWGRYNVITSLESNKVFIAMQFDGNKNSASYKAKECLNDILEKYGLELFSMESNIKLGNIIDTMKAEINRSKFIICDLTHGNKGAYWEAGYAEGQNKKVIYICDKKIFDQNEELSRKGKDQKQIHFDIKQSRIIPFDLSSTKGWNDFQKHVEDTIEANNLSLKSYKFI